jgi:Predicted transcriptional regulator, contains C-terminal CBS domains
MDIADIATREYVQVDSDERLAKVRSLFDRENPKGVIVTTDGEFEGVITERQLLQSHVSDDAKAGKMTRTAPQVDRTENVRDVARMLVEGGVKLAPVFEADRLWGAITEDDILEAVLSNLSVLTVGQIATQEVVTLHEDDGVGHAINQLRENGISRLPIVNEGGRLTGILTTHDIAEFVVQRKDRTTRGDRAGDIDRLLDLPVADMMSSPVETATEDDTVQSAVERMLGNDFAGLVVTPEDSDDLIAGVLTKTDVLRALSYTEEEYMDVQITNVALLETISREEIVRSVEETADKFAKMQVQHAHVRFHEHQEKLRGTPLVQCRIRLRTNLGQVAGSGEGYGAESGFYVALDTLERNVLGLKGTRADEEYEGQLLRKLGEL